LEIGRLHLRGLVEWSDLTRHGTGRRRCSKSTWGSGLRDVHGSSKCGPPATLTRTEKIPYTTVHVQEASLYHFYTRPVRQQMEDKIRHSDIQYTVDLFRPEDARGIVRLFESVYGNDYPIRIYYDPEQLKHANHTGACHSVVARTTDGQVVGVHNLVRSAQYDSTYEWAAGLVLKEYRSLRITERIVEHLMNDLVPRLGIEEVFGEPACNHTHIQKMSARMGFIETALELSLMPASAYSKEKSASGRVTTLLQFRCFKPKPHNVFLPLAYEEELRFLYSALDDSRTLVPVEEHGPEAVRSEVSVQFFDFAQVARIAIHHAGEDVDSRLAEIEQDALRRNVVVLQAWLRLDTPAVASAVHTLRARGYFMGGILPRWFDGDGLLMQQIRGRPDFQSIALYSDRARNILKMVAQDWERSSSAFSS
jgi:hypothetical protein